VSVWRLGGGGGGGGGGTPMNGFEKFEPRGSVELRLRQEGSDSGHSRDSNGQDIQLIENTS